MPSLTRKDYKKEINPAVSLIQDYFNTSHTTNRVGPASVQLPQATTNNIGILNQTAQVPLVKALVAPDVKHKKAYKKQTIVRDTLAKHGFAFSGENTPENISGVGGSVTSGANGTGVDTNMPTGGALGGEVTAQPIPDQQAGQPLEGIKSFTPAEDPTRTPKSDETPNGNFELKNINNDDYKPLEQGLKKTSTAEYTADSTTRSSSHKAPDKSEMIANAVGETVGAVVDTAAAVATGGEAGGGIGGSGAGSIGSAIAKAPMALYHLYKAITYDPDEDDPETVENNRKDKERRAMIQGTGIITNF